MPTYKLGDCNARELAMTYRSSSAFSYQELSLILARRLEAIPANSEAKCY